MTLAALAAAVLASRVARLVQRRHDAGRDRRRAGAGDPEPDQFHAPERGGGRPPGLRADLCRGLRSQRDGDLLRAAAARVRLGSKATRRRTCATTPRPTSASPKRRRARSPSRSGRFPIRSTSTWCARCSRATRARRSDAVLFFDDALAEKKYNNEIAAHYGLVASLLRAQNFKRAQAELATLEKIAPPHPMIEAMAGQVLMQSGQLDAGDRALRDRARPLSRDKKQLDLRLSGGAAEGRPAGEGRRVPVRAAAALTRPTGRCTRSPRAPTRRWASRCCEHQHQAEYYAWQGNLQGAIDQFELAAKAGDGDFYQISVVESRLRALRKELEEQKKGGGEVAAAGCARLGAAWPACLALCLAGARNKALSATPLLHQR